VLQLGEEICWVWRGSPTPKDGVAMNDTTTSSEADGVLVASVWRNAAGGVPLIRLTMTKPDGEGENVRVMSTPAEVLASVEEWLQTFSSD
jgi:hypothetical protein